MCIVLLLLLLASCGNAPNCVLADDFGDRLQEQFIIHSVNPICVSDCQNTEPNATQIPSSFGGPGCSGVTQNYNQCLATCISNCTTAKPTPDWYDTGIDMTSNLYMQVLGTVQVCDAQPIQALLSLEDFTSGGVAISTRNIDKFSYGPSEVAILDPTLHGGQNAAGAVEKFTLVDTLSGGASVLNLRKGEEVVLEVTGTYNPGLTHYASYSGNNAAAEACYNVQDLQTDGSLLDAATQLGVVHPCLFEEGRGLKVQSDFGPKPVGSPRDFPSGVREWSLDQLGSSVSRDVFSRAGVPVTVHTIQVGADSTMKLFYTDPDGDFSNNTGGYVVKAYTNGCVGRGGRFMEAKVGNGPAIEMHTQPHKPWNPQGGSGRLYLRVFDPEGNTDADYQNNRGSYTVWVEMQQTSTIASRIAKFVVTPVVETLYGKLDENNKRLGGVVQQIYNGVATGQFRDIVRAALMLYIILWGFGFIIGYVEKTHYEFLFRVIKIAIVLQLISDTSWEFFSERLFNVFIDGTTEFINKLSGQYGQADVTDFSFMDRSLGVFFVGATWKKLAGLIFTGLIGFVYLICIIVAFVVLFVGFAKALLIYLMSVIAIALLLTVAPIFMSMMLFKFTKSFFDGWLKQLLSYFLQPILVFTTLIIFNEIILVFIQKVLSYSVCWNCIVEVSFDIGALHIAFCILEFFLPWSFSSQSTALPMGLFDIIILLLLVDMLQRFSTFAVQLAMNITGALGTDLSTAVEGMANRMGLNQLGSGIKSLPTRAASAAGKAAVRAGGKAAYGTMGLAKDLTVSTAAAGSAKAASSALGKMGFDKTAQKMDQKAKAKWVSTKQSMGNRYGIGATVKAVSQVPAKAKAAHANLKANIKHSGGGAKGAAKVMSRGAVKGTGRGVVSAAKGGVNALKYALNMKGGGGSSAPAKTPRRSRPTNEEINKIIR